MAEETSQALSAQGCVVSKQQQQIYCQFPSTSQFLPISSMHMYRCLQLASVAVIDEAENVCYPSHPPSQRAQPIFATLDIHTTLGSLTSKQQVMTPDTIMTVPDSRH